MRKKQDAAILALLLGTLGVHRFYLRQPIWGLVYLFLSLSFISTIIGVIDAIVLFSMSDDQFDKKYNPQTSKEVIHVREVKVPVYVSKVPSRKIEPEPDSLFSLDEKQGGNSKISQIRRLESLRDSGVITEEEYLERLKLIV